MKAFDVEFLGLFAERGDQLVGVVAAGLEQSTQHAAVLLHEPHAVADAQAHTHREQLRTVDHAGHTDVQRQLEACVALGGRPLLPNIEVEAHLGAGKAGDARLLQQRLLGVECLVHHLGVEEGVAVGVGGDTDAREAVVGVEKVAQESNDAVVVADGLGRVARNQEHFLEGVAAAELGDLPHGRDVGCEPRRNVRHGEMAEVDEAGGEVEGCLLTLGRTAGHRDRRSRRNVLDLGFEVLHRDHFVACIGDERALRRHRCRPSL